MFTLVSTSVKKLTQKIASEFATMKACPGERRFKEGRVFFLKARLDEGRFHSPRWSYTTLDGEKLRGNGQHSSKMLDDLSSGEWQDKVNGMQVIVDEYTCDSTDDLPELFAQFDPMDSVRSDLDLCRSHAGIHDDLKAVAGSNLVSCVNGIASIQHEFYSADGTDRSTAEQRARLIHNNRDFIKWCSPLIGVRHLRLIGVVAAFYACFSKDEQAADTFWCHVYRESHPDPESPSRVLARFLRDSIGGNDLKNRKWSPRAMYCKSIQAWNAYREGRKTSMRYFPNSPLPEVV